MSTTVTKGSALASWKTSSWMWWVERNSIGIAKYNPTTSGKNKFESPDKVRKVTVYYYKRADAFTEPSAGSGWESEESEIPSQFHEHLVEKAIQWGYERQPAGAAQAQYFGQKFEAGIKRGRKYAYRGRSGTFKPIRPIDF
jgi:hypothetical protein|tara:strand:- start:275 stop:697 length:423 start_codon:yes stop_codon:yes gene_type:complete